MKERGFTIIEVALFLAISGALILLTIGLWSMVSRQRFNDTMTTLRSTIQSEYEEVRTSINERLGSVNITGCDNDGTAGSNKTGNTKCLVIGKLIQFTEGGSEVRISYVVSTNGTNAEYSNMGDEAALRSMTLAVIDNNSNYAVKATDAAVLPKKVRLEWGGEFSKSWTVPTTGSPQQSKALAILHSPISGAVMVFSFIKSANPITANGSLSLGTASNPNAVSNQPLAIMIKNSQPGYAGGAICVDSGSSSVAVRQIILPNNNFYDFNNNAAPVGTTDFGKILREDVCNT